MMLLNQKVDKVDGKGLSTHDYDDAARDLLHTLSNELNNKVDKVEGKGLSTCDFSNAYKNKLDGIENGAQANVIEEIRLFNVPMTITGKAVNFDLSDYYYSKTETDSLLSGKEDKSNKVTSISSQSTDTEYPSAKATHNAIKQALSNVYKFQGTMTVSQLNALVKDASMNGFVYNVANDGNLTVLIGGSEASVQVAEGDNVALVYTNENNIYWDKLAGTFTVDLTAYPTKSGNNTFTGTNTFEKGIDLINGASITKDSSDRINLNYANVAKVKVGSVETTFENRIGFDRDNTNDIGRTGVRVKDIHIGGKLKDGTNEFNADNVFNRINASDIVNNTLTQAQYDLITNGKPTLIIGSAPKFLFPGIIDGIFYIALAIRTIYGNANIGNVSINTSTLVISYTMSNISRIHLNTNQINGKPLPPYPTTNPKPQIPTIAPNGGELSWSDMPQVPQPEPIDIEILEMKIIQDDMTFDENAPNGRCKYDFVDDTQNDERNDPKLAYLHIKSSFIDDYAESQIEEGNFIIRFDYPTFYFSYSRKMKGNGRYSFVKNLYMGEHGSVLDIAEDIERSFLYIEPNDIKTDGRGRKFIYKKIPIVQVLNHLWMFRDADADTEAMDNYFDYDEGFFDQLRVGGAVQTHSDTFLGGGPSRRRDSGTVKYGYTEFSNQLHYMLMENSNSPAYKSPNKDAMLLHYWAPFMISHGANFVTIFTRSKYRRAQSRKDEMNGGMNKLLKFTSEAVVKPRFAILDPDYDVVTGNDSMWVKKYPQYNKRLYCYPAQLFDSLINNEEVGENDVVIFRFGISK